MASTPGPPPLPAAPLVWECPGTHADGQICDFECVEHITIANFVNATDFAILRWVGVLMSVLYIHVLMSGLLAPSYAA